MIFNHFQPGEAAQVLGALVTTALKVGVSQYDSPEDPEEGETTGLHAGTEAAELRYTVHLIVEFWEALGQHLEQFGFGSQLADVAYSSSCEYLLQALAGFGLRAYEEGLTEEVANDEEELRALLVRVALLPSLTDLLTALAVKSFEDCQACLRALRAGRSGRLVLEVAKTCDICGRLKQLEWYLEAREAHAAWLRSLAQARSLRRLADAAAPHYAGLKIYPSETGYLHSSQSSLFESVKERFGSSSLRFRADALELETCGKREAFLGKTLPTLEQGEFLTPDARHRSFITHVEWGMVRGLLSHRIVENLFDAVRERSAEEGFQETLRDMAPAFGFSPWLLSALSPAQAARLLLRLADVGMGGAPPVVLLTAKDSAGP